MVIATAATERASQRLTVSDGGSVLAYMTALMNQCEQAVGWRMPLFWKRALVEAAQQYAEGMAETEALSARLEEFAARAAALESDMRAATEAARSWLRERQLGSSLASEQVSSGGESGATAVSGPCQCCE